MTNSKSRSPILAMTVLAIIATMLVSSSLLVSSADAKKSNDDDKDEFSKLFGKSNDKEKDKDKKPNKDPQGDSPLVDFDIKDYGFKGKNAFVEIYGVAGRTLAPHEDEAIGYVINIITRSGEEQTWAVDSHERQHGGSNTGAEWHAQRVFLTDDPATIEVDAKCLNGVDHVTPATMDGNRAVFEDMKAKGADRINAKRITSSATVLLKLQVDDPDAPLPPGIDCIAKVTQVFDTADLSNRERGD